MFTIPEKNVWEFGFLHGERVADFGAGIGHYTLPLSRAVGDSGLVYAVDIHPHALEMLHREAREAGRGNINTLTGDIEQYGGSGLRDDLLDGVVLSNVMFLLEREDRAVREARRVLRPGGRVFIIDWHDKFPRDYAHELMEAFDLEFVRRFETGDHHYGLVFRK
jgi:ubiquinone/menaquinone biosynthesis C-methylase UbiE